MGRTVTKSIAIIGEGETGWFYFDSLRIACRYPFKVAPDFPQHSDINHILKLVESYLNKQYDNCFPNCRNICRDMKRPSAISSAPTSINT